MVGRNGRGAGEGCGRRGGGCRGMIVRGEEGRDVVPITVRGDFTHTMVQMCLLHRRT